MGGFVTGAAQKHLLLHGHLFVNVQTVAYRARSLVGSLFINEPIGCSAVLRRGAVQHVHY